MITPLAIPGFSLSSCRHALLLTALLLSAHSAHAAEWDIDQLMRGLAQTRSDRARFVEKKSIAMLTRPVESSGELFYSAPDHLEKRTIKPKAESMILDRGMLTIEREQQRHVLPLQDYPELAAFIESIRATLAGDRKALEHSYRLALEGSVERWSLQLLPVDEKIQSVVRRIRISGVRDTLRSIEIIQADGDSSLMLIERLTTP